MDADSDYLTSFSVMPFPCAVASSEPSRPPHVHVRFSHQVVEVWIDEEEEYEIESRTICLSDDLLAKKSGDDSRIFILCEGLRDWPIDAVTALEIADQVVEKARRLRCDLQVHIRSVQ
nr:uncharacterized protein LOC109151188 [Ipomoea trifida]